MHETRNVFHHREILSKLNEIKHTEKILRGAKQHRSKTMMFFFIFNLLKFPYNKS